MARSVPQSVLKLPHVFQRSETLGESSQKLNNLDILRFPTSNAQRRNQRPSKVKSISKDPSPAPAPGSNPTEMVAGPQDLGAGSSSQSCLGQIHR